MAIIRTYGDPILRKKSKDIENIDGSVSELAQDMIESLKAYGGIGLAANQVGVDKRIFVVDRSNLDLIDEPLIAINPKIVEISGKQTEEEGCLSIPETFDYVTRPIGVTVKALDLDGKELQIQGKGLLARVLAHEIDHLDGVLFIDHLSAIRRKLLSGKLKKIAEKQKQKS